MWGESRETVLNCSPKLWYVNFHSINISTTFAVVIEGLSLSFPYFIAWKIVETKLIIS